MMTTILTVCPICRESHEIEVSFEGYLAYIQGAHVQDAFPTLPADEREMLISGVCPKCWDNMFSDDED